MIGLLIILQRIKKIGIDEDDIILSIKDNNSKNKDSNNKSLKKNPKSVRISSVKQEIRLDADDDADSNISKICKKEKIKKN